MILIIAYGNNLRRDDGAGLLLAERLEAKCHTRQMKVERIVVHQLTPELSLEVARAEVTAVVFVDAREANPAEPDLGVQIRPVATDIPSPTLGHHLHPVSLLVYARLLYGQHPPAWELTVPGVDFGHGESLSQVTQEALATAGEALAALLAQLEQIEGAKQWPIAFAQR